MKLVNPERAVVDMVKLTGYCLRTTREHGNQPVRSGVRDRL